MLLRRRIELASVCSTEAVATVYNLRVADHHTYFVGGGIWGWDVWVHNANYEFRKISSQGMGVFANQGPSRRLFEVLRKANLDPPNNFPGIDRINRSTGLGTSMKTIDLNSAFAGNKNQFRAKIRQYVEELRQFSGPQQRWSSELGDYVRVPALRSRRLELGVQDGMLTNWQRSIIKQEAGRAGRLKNPVQIAVFEIGV